MEKQAANVKLIVVLTSARFSQERVCSSSDTAASRLRMDKVPSAWKNQS